MNSNNTSNNISSSLAQGTNPRTDLSHAAFKAKLVELGLYDLDLDGVEKKVHDSSTKKSDGKKSGKAVRKTSAARLQHAVKTVLSLGKNSSSEDITSPKPVTKAAFAA